MAGCVRDGGDGVSSRIVIDSIASSASQYKLTKTAIQFLSCRFGISAVFHLRADE